MNKAQLDAFCLINALKEKLNKAEECVRAENLAGVWATFLLVSQHAKEGADKLDKVLNKHVDAIEAAVNKGV